MINSLLEANIELFEELLEEALLNIPSYYDTKTENSYHMFLLGMLVYLQNDYEIISNKEAGYGRVDIIVLNKSDKTKPAIVIELKIVDSFDFLIYAKDVPKYVERVTGINQKMLQNQKSQKEILRKFRIFLGDSIFVAHPAEFDYNFLAYQFEKENIGKLLNRSICTLTLAQKTLKANRYGLKYLMEEFNFPQEVHHRALGDAKTTARVFLKALENLPAEIKTAEDLIDFL